jgi:hypothetical protein
MTILIFRVLGYVQNSVLTANFIAPLDLHEAMTRHLFFILEPQEQGL